MKVHKLGPSDDATWDVRIHGSAKTELLELDDEEFDRMDAHLAMLAHDPLRPRPGMDIKRLKDIETGGLYRLRVGKHRAIYATITADRRVYVLVIEDRELGYARMIQRAMARLRGA